MAPKWTDDLNLKFVELYKDQRCLWDQLDELYKDKNARETALVSIVENLNIQGFGVAEVKAKIKAFRGTFNIEWAKHQKSAKSGCGASDVYVPSLKWFSAMKDVMVKGTLTRNTKSTLMPGSCKNADIATSVEPAETSAGHPESEERVVSLDPTESLDNSDFGVCRETSGDGDYPPKKKFKPRSKIQQIASAARDLKTLSESLSHKNENEWDIFGRHVAAQMKVLTPFQALTAQMEINNVLSKCRFNDLCSSTSSGNRGSRSPVSGVCSPSTASNNFVISPEIEQVSNEVLLESTVETP